MASTQTQTQQLQNQPAQQVVAAKQQLTLPSDKTLQQATKLSLKLTKPIDFYFYVESLKGNISIVNVDGEKIIFKSEDEHTSPILNTYKSDNSYIVVTENTIYMVSTNTKVK
jgi:hypothetical protein